jgi:hypothetical protein
MYKYTFYLDKGKTTEFIHKDNIDFEWFDLSFDIDGESLEVTSVDVTEIKGLNFEKELSILLTKYSLDKTLNRSDQELAKLVTRFLNILLTYKNSDY